MRSNKAKMQGPCCHPSYAALYLACVKKVAYVYAKVSLEPYYIATCAVHYLIVMRAMRKYNFGVYNKTQIYEKSILYLFLGWIFKKFS